MINDGKVFYFKLYLHLLGDQPFPDYFIDPINIYSDFMLRPFIDIRLQFISQAVISKNTTPVLVDDDRNECIGIMIIPFGQTSSYHITAVDDDGDKLWTAMTEEAVEADGFDENS